MKQQKRAGFTLLELLVVIVIVAILASLALPQFLKTFSKAREAEASSVLGTVLGAVFAYRQEKTIWPTAVSQTAVDLPVGSNWTYAAPTGTGATSATLTITGTQVGNTSHTVTATVSTDGIRTLTFST